MTKPRALTSAPSPDPKEEGAGSALSPLSVRSWTPVSDSPQTAGDQQEAISPVPVLTHVGWLPSWDQLDQLAARGATLHLY